MLTERCKQRLMDRTKAMLLTDKPAGMAWNDTMALLVAYAVMNMLDSSGEFTVKAHNTRKPGNSYYPGGFGGGGHHKPDDE